MLGGPREQMNFYGAVTVGERGQVAIPAEARREFEITPNTKLLVFSGPGKKALMLIKADNITEFISNMTDRLSQYERMLRDTPSEEPPEENS